MVRFEVEAAAQASLSRIGAPIDTAGYSSPPPLDRRAPLMALVAFVASFSDTIVLALAPWLVWTTRQRMRERSPVFPSGFHEGVEMDAAGLAWCTAIVAAYHAGTAFSGLGILAPWSWWIGRKGRRAVVVAGLCGMSTSAVLFGLTDRSLSWAVATRFVWGLFSVDVPLARTLMCDGYEQENRAKALHYSSLVAGAGSSLGFVVAGYFSLPAEATHFAAFPRDHNLERFPFLLPCLVVAVLAAAAAMAQCLFLKEAWHHFRASAVSVRNRLGRGTGSAGPYAAVGGQSPRRRGASGGALAFDDDGADGGDGESIALEEEVLDLDLEEREEEESEGEKRPAAAATAAAEKEGDSEGGVSDVPPSPSSPARRGHGRRHGRSHVPVNFEPLSIASASAAIGRGGPLAQCGSGIGQLCACARLCRCGEGGLGIHFAVAAIVSAVEITASALFPIWAMRPWHGGGFAFSIAHVGSFFAGCAVPSFLARLTLRRCCVSCLSERVHCFLSLVACAALVVVVPHSAVLGRTLKLPRPLCWLALLLLWTLFHTTLEALKSTLLVWVNAGCGDDLRGAANRTLYVGSAACTAAVLLVTTAISLLLIEFSGLVQAQWPLYELAWYVQGALLLLAAALSLALPRNHAEAAY